MSQALNTVEAAAKGASAEGADLGVATQALTSIMASYGASIGGPVQAENELIRGAGLAKTTYQDFASSLANVIPLASSLHLSFAQVAGAEDTMTQHGETAQRASENLANLITNLAGQNNVASASLQQLGVDTIDLSKNLGKRGLTGSLDLVLEAINKHGKDGEIVTSAFKQAAIAEQSLRTEIDKMPKSMQANAKAFVDGSMSYKDFYKYTKSLGGQQFAMAKDLITTQRAAQGFNKQLTSGNSTVSTLARTLQKSLGGVTGMRTALMLSGNSAKTFTDDVNSVSEAARKSGADILGWAQTQDTLDNKMKRAKESLQVLAVEVGDELMPVVEAGAKTLGSFVNGIGNLSHTDKEILGWSAVTLAALGPIMSIGGRLATVGAGISRFTTGTVNQLGRLSTRIALNADGISAGMGRITSALAGAGVGFALGEITQNSSTATKALGALGAAATGAAVGYGLGGALGAAIGGTAGLLTDAATAFHLFGGSAKQQIKPTEEFTQAILADNDALGVNTRKLVENSLQSKGAYDAALKLGISQKTLTDAMMGIPGALAKVQAAQLGVTSSIGYGTTATAHLTKAQQAQIDANAKLSSVIGDVTQTLKVNQQAANNIAAADGKRKASTDSVTSSTRAAANATRAATSSGNAYLDVLAKLVREHKIKVSANVLNAIEGIRRVEVELGGLHGRTVEVKTIYSSTGKVTMRAAGGPITGPGTGTSDSIPARLSNGEYVINAKSAARNRPLLDAINSGAPGFAAGGMQGDPTVLAAITAGTTPAPTTVPPLSAILAQHIRGGSAAQDAADDALARYKQLAAQLKVVTDATNKRVAAAKDEVSETKAAADKAKYLAEQMPTVTKAQRDAKHAAEDHARALRLVETRAENVAKRVETAAKAQETAAKNAASSAKSSYQTLSQSAQAATQIVVQAAQAVQAAFSSQMTAFLQTVDTFKQSTTVALTSGSSVSSIWGQMLGLTDANGNPIPPNLGVLQTNEQAVLAQLQSFTTDLNTLTSEGANQDLINELLGVQSANGTSAADNLAQQLLAGGGSSITALQSVMSQIATTAGSETDTLTQQFYGAGAQSIDNIGKGILAEFPSLTKAIAPVLAQLAKDFTLTPVITAPNTSALTGLGAVPGSGKHGGSATIMVPYTLPAFANGASNYTGMAVVGDAGPEIVNLHGQDVIPNNVVKSGAFASMDNAALIAEVRALRAEVRSLPQANGREMATAGAGLYARAGQAHSEQTRRAFRKGAIG
jgi:hypothetical protein